jgi:bifunctional DNA-binding transcriptional regulator/antitoxin component of YhaV-PrlF toxin-antitoxin module
MIKFSISKSDLHSFYPNKKLIRVGSARYGVILPNRIMKAFDWKEGEEVDIIITTEEIIIKKKNLK